MVEMENVIICNLDYDVSQQTSVLFIQRRVARLARSFYPASQNSLSAFSTAPENALSAFLLPLSLYLLRLGLKTSTLPSSVSLSATSAFFCATALLKLPITVFTEGRQLDQQEEMEEMSSLVRQLERLYWRGSSRPGSKEYDQQGSLPSPEELGLPGTLIRRPVTSVSK